MNRLFSYMSFFSVPDLFRMLAMMALHNFLSLVALSNAAMFVPLVFCSTIINYDTKPK